MVRNIKLLRSFAVLFLSVPLYHFTTLPLSAIEPGKFYTDGPRTKKAVALTFDDGPGPFTKQVLDILDQHQVKATFFMNGDQVAMRPEVAKEVARRGHELGDHTWSHINFYAYEKKNGAENAKTKIRDEIRMSKDLIEKTCGVELKILRMPNGFSRAWMKDIAREFGYALVNWTFGEDWHNLPEEKMAQDYLAHVKPGSILLFHDGGRNREKTLRIVPQVIEKARSQGLALLTLTELLN